MNINLIIGLGAIGAFVIGSIIIGFLTFFGIFNTHHLATIILSVTLVATFIGVYFFTYGTHLEKTVIENQMEYIVSELVGELKVVAPEAAQKARITVQNMKAPDMKKADADAAAFNKQLLKQAITVLGIIFAVGIISSLCLVFFTDIHKKEFFITNLLSIVIVGITYFVFTNFAGRYFISADPNFVRKTILETLKKVAGPLTDAEKVELVKQIAQEKLQKLQNTTNTFINK